MRFSIIIPTYNEAKNIVSLLDQIKHLVADDTEIIIVDDNSPDGTADIVRKYNQNISQKIRLIVRKNESGLSSAILKGVSSSLNEVIIIMDADNSHPPHVIPRLIQEIVDHDLVIASRYMPGGLINNWSAKRKLISKTGTLVAKTGLRIKQEDPLSGFFAFKKNIIQKIDFDAIGYKILLEILVKTEGISIKEIPYEFSDRKLGQSKLDVFTVLDFIKAVWKLYRYGKVSQENRTSVKFLSKSARFFTVGATGLLVNFLTISLILDLSSIWYIHANVIGIFVSMTSNFLLNKCWTFEDINFQIKNTLKQYTKFLLFSSVGAAVQLSLIYYLVDIHNIDYTSSLILAVLAAGFGNFILNKKFTFNESIWS